MKPFDVSLEPSEPIKVGIKNPKIIDVELIDNNLEPIDVNCIINPRWIDLDVDKDEDLHLDLREYVKVSGGESIESLTADKVIFKDDIVCAGKYTQVGNVTKGIDETIILPAKNKSLKDVVTSIFTKEEQPTKVNPSINITFSQAKAYEVGTTVVPSYSVSYNKGSYTYDDDTGVTFSNLNVVDTNGHSSSSTSGSFNSFLVLDNTKYNITATINHSDGVVARTNLGNLSNPVVKIYANSISKASSFVTGYRPFFYGLTTTLDLIDSDIIRGLVNGGDYNGSKTILYDINGAAAKRVILAIPKSSKRSGLDSVFKVDGLRTDITEVWEKQSITVPVDDKRKTGMNFSEYVLWIYQPAKIDGNEQYEIKLG